MTAALLGLLGVILGLAIGRGYGFWAERRTELADAAAGAAALGEELRRGLEATSPSLIEVWNDNRRSLAIHLSPRDYRTLAQAIDHAATGQPDQLEGKDLTKRVEALHVLFWEEHEAFILVPLIHYLRGDTVSKRAREILDSARDIDTLPLRGKRSPVRSWHSASEPPTQRLDH
ncbi:MAG TPA: hypothetical protein VFI17_05865 [Solirubrobacterales bacterium]|nr:hypothetical protein [Solirubrobacterales bacterium]